MKKRKVRCEARKKKKFPVVNLWIRRFSGVRHESKQIGVEQN